MRLRTALAWPVFGGLLAGVLLRSSRASAGVTWKADFEAGNLSEFNGNVNATKGTRKNIEFVMDPVQQGTVAGKFTIHDNDTFGATQMRVQITRSGSRTGEGQDVFISWYFRLPADPLVRDNIAYWESNSSFRNMMTWWVTPKQGGGTTFDFGTGNLGSTKHIYSEDISINQWHQVASHIHWSTNSQQGHIIVWLDGAKIVDESAQTKADGNSLFFQAGIQRANRSTAVDSIYFDNFLEADTLEDIMVGAPMPAPDAGSVQDGTPRLDGSDDAGTSAESGGSAGADGDSGTPSSNSSTGNSTARDGTNDNGENANARGGSAGSGTNAGGAEEAPAASAGGEARPPAGKEKSGCAVSTENPSKQVGSVTLALAMLAAMGLLRRRHGESKS